MDVDGGVGGEDHTRVRLGQMCTCNQWWAYGCGFRRHSAVDRRRRREGHLRRSRQSTRRTPTSTEPSTDSAGIPPEVSGAGRALPFRGNGFRRDHQVRDLQRRHRGDRKSNAGAAFLDPRAPDGIDRRGPCRAAIVWIREFAGGRHTGADRRKAVGAQGGRTVLRHHLFPGGGLRHVRHRIVEGGVVVEGALFEKEVIPALQ